MDRGETTVLMSSGDLNQPPVLDLLKRRRDDTAKQLSNLDAAIEKLEKNPEVYGVLEALSKVGHYQ